MRAASGRSSLRATTTFLMCNTSTLPAMTCRDIEVLSLLLAEGHRPERLLDRGTRAIASLVQAMTWQSYGASSYLHANERRRRNLDSSGARERLKMIHMLVAHGANGCRRTSNRSATSVGNCS
jgi:hypothetical protein